MGTQLPLPRKGGTAPQFSVHVCCGQIAGWIKIALGMMVALGPGNIVLDVDPAPPKEHSPPDFGSYLLRPNGWMDEDALGTKVGVSPGHILLHGDIAPLPKGALPPIFGPRLLWPNSRPSHLLLSTCYTLW